jgi:hypothetical protein
MMRYDHLGEIRDPGHSVPEPLSANRPDMGRIDLTSGTDTDITHRREPWHPYASVLRGADRKSPVFYGELACLRERILLMPETVPTMSYPEFLLGHSSYGGSHRLSVLIQANAADPFALRALERDTWEICACSLVQGYDALTDLSLCQRLEGDFCGY